MWVFSILFLISLLVTIVGLIMLIPKKTREKGKRIAIGFLIICLVSYVAARFGGNSYPNDEPGTITKSEYKEIKEGMSKDEVKNILGDPHKDNKDVNEWDYIGINGVEKNAEVSFSFDPEDKLELKLDGGLIQKDKNTENTSKNNSTSVPDTHITKKQYQQIKIGMTKNEIKNIIDESKDKIENSWYYSNADYSFATITFDDKAKKVIAKSETGILSNSSSTITDKNGTRKDQTAETSGNDTTNNSDRYNKIESDIKSIIDKDFTFDTTLKKFELNENSGTDKKGDYVALIYLSYNQANSAKTTKKWIDEYTNDLAAKLAKKETEITSLSIFWETPQFKKDWNTAKFNLTKNKNAFYFDSQNYDGTVFK